MPTQIQKQIEEAVKSFRKEFNCPIVNGEPLNAGELLNEPIELFLRKHLSTIASKSAEIERKKIIDDVMIEIDGHYDNPNLAGNLEEYFGITYQEWEEQQ